MSFIQKFKQDLSQIDSSNFESKALSLFEFQYKHNQVYRSFVDYIPINAAKVSRLSDIPHLPIQFFKNHRVFSKEDIPDTYFSSSGTSGSNTSQHFYTDELFYLHHAQHIFEQAYGQIKGKVILGLLPSYLERKGSSLITMVDYFIKESGHHQSGFFLYDHEQLFNTISENKEAEIVLFGVAFALLDFANKFNLSENQNLKVIETGGMKGRKKEITREELHHELITKLGVNHIHSEYGMTELLSQAYSKSSGLFDSPSSMSVSIREVNDPFTLEATGKTGGINIIDLANVESCAFIATDDLGRIHESGQFEVLGRFDNSDIRGCSLLIQ